MGFVRRYCDSLTRSSTSSLIQALVREMTPDALADFAGVLPRLVPPVHLRGYTGVLKTLESLR